MTGAQIMRVLALAGVVGGLAVPATAQALDTTFTFDDLAANTVVSTQYQGRGLTFGPSVAGQRQATSSLPTVTTVGTTAAASGDRVGKVQRFCASPECIGTAETWASFSSAQAVVRLSVGAFGTASTTLTATAFNGSGAQVAQSSTSVTGGQGFRTQLSVSTATASIRFVRVRASTLQVFGIDSLFMSNTASTGPDFSISAPFGTHVVPQGGTFNIPVTLTRRNSSGSIVVNASGLPAQVSAAPQIHTLASASPLASTVTFNLPLTATATAPPATDRDITITAAPDGKAAGIGTRTLLVRIRVLVLHDLRVIAVEPTQAIQTPTFAVTNSGNTATYTGVGLGQRHRTIVRVYVTNARGSVPVSGVVARLYGFNSSGAALPGSPLFPDQGSKTVLFSTLPAPTFADRSSATAPFTYTLPLSWTGSGSDTSFVTRLRADVVPPSGSIALRECDGCTANDTFTLSGVGYTPTCCVTVASAIITATGGSTPRAVSTIMAPGLPLFPLQFDLKPYGTTLDASEGLQTNSEGVTSIERSVAIEKLLDFNQTDGQGEAVLGVLSPEFSDGFGRPPFGIFDDLPDRPLSSSAHELGHAIGLPHGSPSCGGGGPDWLPDQVGLIGGFALDSRGASPYRAFATPPDLDNVMPSPLPTEAGGGDPRAFFDLMSYCGLDANMWISPRNWNALLTRWRGGADSGVNSVASLARAAQAPGSLNVNASVGGDGGVRLLSVRPLAPKAESGLSPSPYRLVVRGAGGMVLSDVAMAMRTFVVDRDGPPPVVLQGTAPILPSTARSVEIVRDGAVVARRDRSASAPTARFVSPRRGTRVGRGSKLTIRWQAADADSDPLDIHVEWSARGGRPGTWRSIFLGPNGGTVGLPSEYFAGSDDAFLRLRVNDGFNETVVLSPRFRTVHHRPAVSIETPRPGARVRRDASLLLTARAIDERRAPIRADRIRWFNGRRQIARGNGVAVRGLTPGPKSLRAEATDDAGRKASATVRVNVVAVAPAFTVLRAPARIAARARSVRLRVATSLAGRLVVRGGRRVVRARTRATRRTITVPITTARDVLHLRLTVSADGQSRTAIVDVDRR